MQVPTLKTFADPSITSPKYHCSEACHLFSVTALNKLITPNSANPSTEASSTAANTLSTLCCVRATSTTDPSPSPPINSPTMAPITASPEAIRSPVKICGSAAGNRSLNSVSFPEAP